MIASATESVYGRRQPARRPARRGHGLAGPTVQIKTNLVLLLPALIEQNKLLSFISRRNIERGTRVKEVRSVKSADDREAFAGQLTRFAAKR